jgi:hypothetical protein
MLKKLGAAGAFILIAACSNDAATSLTKETAADMAMPAPSPVAERSMRALEHVTASAQAAQVAQVDRKTIRTAQIRIELEDVGRAIRSADSIAAATQGFLANTQRSQGDGGYSEASLVMRVPADQFPPALDALRKLGRVRVDNSNTEDVTRSYNDLTIRLAVKRDLVTRLRGLLVNRTAKLSDLIEVERELARAITELEQMEGERRFMDNQIAMSTIHVSFYHAPIPGPGGVLDPVTVALRNALRVLGQSLATVISVLVFATPWALIGAVIWLVLRLRRRRIAATPTPT